ncbi:hypothetical protein [Oceaniferula spumae]
MNKDSNNDFTTISEFLSAFAPEVSGRSTDIVTPELHGKLENLASGKLGEDEGRSISREILANENAMKTLAGLLSNDA